MRETIDRHRVGRHTARANIYYTVALADPDAIGNCGGEGIDDESVDRRCPNAGLARGWAQRTAAALAARPGHVVMEVKVIVERWDADEWEDRVYGTILDAEAVPETEQYGDVADDGSIEWREPEPVRSY